MIRLDYRQVSGVILLLAAGGIFFHSRPLMALYHAAKLAQILQQIAHHWH